MGLPGRRKANLPQNFLRPCQISFSSKRKKKEYIRVRRKFFWVAYVREKAYARITYAVYNKRGAEAGGGRKKIKSNKVTGILAGVGEMSGGWGLRLIPTFFQGQS